MLIKFLQSVVITTFTVASILSFTPIGTFWESKFIQVGKDGSLQYVPDENGNIIPDFSLVGYAGGNQPVPDIPIVKMIQPAATGSSAELIQNAIDEIAQRTPGKDGFRGTLLLKKGTYIIPSSIRISK